MSDARGGAAGTEVSATPRPHSPTALFVAFTLMSLQGFGGVVAITQRELCERRRWLTRQEFIEILSLGQLLPGPNICNLSLIVGDRFFGTRGAFAALAGMVAAPLLIVLVIASLYTQWQSVPEVAGALRGMAIVSAGLIAGTALRLASAIAPGPLGHVARLVFAGATFLLIGLLRMPLVWTLLSLGTVATAYAWWRLSGSRGTRP